MCATIEIYNKHKLKWRVELVLDEPNSNSIICTLLQSIFPQWLIIEVTLVVVEPQRILDLWTFDFDQQTLQWTLPIEQMMTSNTWQFSHFLECRYSWVKYGQHLGHLFL